MFGYKTSISRTITTYKTRKDKAFYGNTNLLGSTKLDAKRALESAIYCISKGQPLDEVAENLLITYKAAVDCNPFIKEANRNREEEASGNARFIYDIADFQSNFIWAIEGWIRGWDLDYFSVPKNAPLKYSPPRWLSSGNKLYQPGIKVFRGGKSPRHYHNLVGIEYTPRKGKGALSKLISTVLHPEATPEKVAEMVKAANKGYRKAFKAYSKAKAAYEASKA